jgi:primosomal protein N' (replication factor Y)
VPVEAATVPVARVAVDTGLAHLDRPFDYLVPEQFDEQAVPGVRVRVRFAGRLVDGYLLERVAASESGKKLSFLDRVVSVEAVLAPEIAELCRTVADRYAGSLEDVLRLAVPPRHAATEAKPAAPVDTPLPDPAGTDWSRYQAGPAFRQAITDRRPARAVWQALPGEDWAARLAELAHTALAGGRGAILIVPDASDVARLDAALLSVLGPGRHVALSADLGPAERYKRFLAVRRGHVRVAIGTRAAAFAPVHDLGLVAVFDDGDDSLAEPRAPYPHAREVLMLRSAAAQIPLLIGGFARTAEAQLLVESAWAKAIQADRATVRAAAPRIEAAGDDRATGADSAAAFARLSPAAFQAARAALSAGLPVLVQVPRRGYQPALACVSCRRPAHCRVCSGPLQLTRAQQVASCRWCGALATGWTCSVCAATAFRATVVGAGRTSEELGRAFAGVRILTSAGDAGVSSVPAEPVVVVATPGMEPATPDGYGAALLLDGSALLARPDLRAAEETLRRWMAAATLVRPATSGGRVVVGADSSLATVQALIRWDPAGHAAAELAARREFGFPPAVAMAAVDGGADGVASFLGDLHLPDGAEVLGPVPVEHTGSAHADKEAERALVRIELGRGRELAAALHAARAARSARKDPDPARARMDPLSLL